MAQHTPLVEAFAKMTANRSGELNAAAHSHGTRNINHSRAARQWLEAAWILQEQASEDEQLIMQQIWHATLGLEGGESV